MNSRFFSIAICAAVVLLAAIIAGTPTGVAGSNQQGQDYWERETAAGMDSPSDNPVAALRARITRLESRVSTLESQSDKQPEPVRSSVPASEPWQTATVVEMAPVYSSDPASEPWQTATVVEIAPVYSSDPQPVGQYRMATTITESTQTVCTGGVCRPQNASNSGPLRRLFRR
jgi:hypothetical protein